jgi:hypothetical protein
VESIYAGTVWLEIRRINSMTILSQGSVQWLVTKDAMGMVSWVAKGKLPDSEEFVLARGFTSQFRAAQTNMVHTIVDFIMKRRGRSG